MWNTNRAHRSWGAAGKQNESDGGMSVGTTAGWLQEAMNEHTQLMGSQGEDGVAHSLLQDAGAGKIF